jgi:hypothetical protein
MIHFRIVRGTRLLTRLAIQQLCPYTSGRMSSRHGVIKARKTAHTEQPRSPPHLPLPASTGDDALQMPVAVLALLRTGDVLPPRDNNIQAISQHVPPTLVSSSPQHAPAGDDAALQMPVSVLAMLRTGDVLPPRDNNIQAISQHDPPTLASSSPQRAPAGDDAALQMPVAVLAMLRTGDVLPPRDNRNQASLLEDDDDKDDDEA